jgi:hypothetical protein
MNHQPFETWILDVKNEELSIDQRKALYEHLLECIHCQQIQSSWDAARQQMDPHHMAAPRRGFAQRWQTAREQKLIQKQHRQTRWIFAGFTLTALLALGLWVAYTLAHISIPQILVSAFILFSWIFIEWNIVSTFIMVLRNTIPSYIPICLWIFFSTSFCLLGFIWALSIWKIFGQGVHTK